MNTRRWMLTLTLAILFIFCSGPSAWTQTKVDINTATVEELTRLKGVGPKTAERIIEFREENGLFNEPADIINVPRVGQKILEDNRDLISTGN